MKQYTLALTILCRLVAVILVLLTIYGWLVAFVMPTGFGGLIFRLSLIKLAFAAFLYFKAAYLVRVITRGED